MKQTRYMEISVGLFVAAGMIALFFLAMKVSNLTSISSDAGYTVTAYFENIGGLKVRSPVTVSGVLVGRVSAIDYDPARFEARVSMEIESRYDNLPDDTAASIFTAGLLGEQYIGLEPGASETNLKEGSELKLTQSALVLEQIIGQFLFSKAQEGAK
ncbi:MAG: outer membrane lipid asymmetry maintenance protein MlaD [Chromatiales bacterium]|nr:outer membrane lipid asymmetry maintenance protein MlaD [Chromatiales bacterium]